MTKRQFVLVVVDRDTSEFTVERPMSATGFGTVRSSMLKTSAATSDASVWEILRRMSLDPNGARLTGSQDAVWLDCVGLSPRGALTKRHRLIDLPASTRQLAQSRQHGPQMAIVSTQAAVYEAARHRQLRAAWRRGA
jgi:hypothetical protein